MVLEPHSQMNIPASGEDALSSKQILSVELPNPELISVPDKEVIDIPVSEPVKPDPLNSQDIESEEGEIVF